MAFHHSIAVAFITLRHFCFMFGCDSNNNDLVWPLTITFHLALLHSYPLSQNRSIKLFVINQISCQHFCFSYSGHSQDYPGKRLDQNISGKYKDLNCIFLLFFPSSVPSGAGRIPLSARHDSCCWPNMWRGRKDDRGGEREKQRGAKAWMEAIDCELSKRLWLLEHTWQVRLLCALGPGVW